MQVFKFNTYEEMSQHAAEDLVQLMKERKDPLLCVASGDSPAGMYKYLIQKFQKKELDISNWSFVGLDEWIGMNENDQGSCKYHLNNYFFHPLKIDDKKVFFFDGRTKDVKKECDAAENYIKQHGGMDVAILGLGMNGHIGMNEPNTSVSSRTHIQELHPITQQVGQKYFKERQHLKEGITLGIGTIMEAKTILLLISGQKKAAIVKQLLEGKISEEVPGSLLRNHPGTRIYLDAEAASLLSK